MLKIKGAVAAISLSFAVTAGLWSASASTASAEVVESARAALPAEVRDSGVLKVATSYYWPPFGYKDDKGEPAGFDIELITILSAKLGLTPQFEDLKFPSLVPGVGSGRFDVAVNQIGITPERAQVADFVGYMSTGHSLLVRADSEGIDINNLCGHRLAITIGGITVNVATKLNEQCKAEGKPEIEMIYFGNTAETTLAVATGRADAQMGNRATAVWISKQNPKVKPTDAVLSEGRTLASILVRKGNKPLQTALLEALQASVADGSYGALMAKYDIVSGTLTAEQMAESTR